MVRSLLLALLLPAMTLAQEVKLPAEIQGGIGAWIIVAPEIVSGGKPKYRIDPGLTDVRLDLLFPPEVATQSRGKVVASNVAGRFKVECWNAKGDVASDIATCWVVVGSPPPQPGPTPVNPPQPAPLPGLRVLILEETSPSTLLPRQQSIAIRSLQVRAYLDSKALKGPGGHPEWRNLDPDSPVTNLSKEWQDLRARTNPASLPWVVIADSSGGVVFEGPYPETEADALALFKKYGG